MSTIRLPSNNDQTFWTDKRVRDVWNETKTTLLETKKYQNKTKYIHRIKSTNKMISLYDTQLLWENQLKTIEREGRSKLYELSKIIRAEQAQIQIEKQEQLQMEKEEKRILKLQRTKMKMEREAAEALLRLSHPERFMPIRSTRVSNR